MRLLKVGPRSAGADPGPACYGMGGDEPTREMWIGLRDVFDADFIAEVEGLSGAPIEDEHKAHTTASGTSVRRRLL